MVYLLDTNIFVRFFVKEDEKSFNECYTLLDKVQRNLIKAVTNTLVIAEVVWLLKSYYKLDRQTISMIVKAINCFNGLKIISNYELNLAAGIFQDYNLKFVDALIATIPQIFTKKWTIISYDKDFDQIDVVRKEPAEINRLNKQTGSPRY